MIDWNKMTPEQQSDYIAMRVRDRRELDFRAWDIREQKMYPCFGWMNGQVLIIRDGNPVGDKDDYYELMQYTNITDYHKKKIYDGDVTQITELYGAKQQAKVFWGPVTADYQWMNGETWLLHFTSGAEGPLYPYCKPLNYYRLEVIGNIYEHPGLLPN